MKDRPPAHVASAFCLGGRIQIQLLNQSAPHSREKDGGLQTSLTVRYSSGAAGPAYPRRVPEILEVPASSLMLHRETGSG